MCRLFVIIQLILLPLTVRSWDLAVAVGDHIELLNLTATGGIISTENITFPERVLATALAFDTIENVMYISDTHHGKASGIYSINLNSTGEPKLLVEEPVEADKHNSILGIVYDYVTKSLFWTNGFGKAILYLSLNELTFERKVLHQLDKATTGIALDVCSRTLFWATMSGTIERSHINGSNHEVLFTEINFPTDITVDQKLGKLFWCDDSEGIYFKIESSNLDGSSRQVLVHHVNQRPVSVATTPTHIFWTDRQNTVICGRQGTTTIIEKDSFSVMYEFKSSNIRGLISKDNSIILSECKSQTTVRSFLDVTLMDAPITESVINTSLDHWKESVETPERNEICFPMEGYCVNGGVLEKGDSNQCKCPKGYSGLRCELSPCHNYCINNNGKCYVDARGFAQCTCMKGYLGERCEQDACKNYCLNGGRCEINDMENPVCNCDGVFQGRHCEINCNFVCQQQFLVPLEGGITPLCPCTSDGKYDVENTENTSSALNDRIPETERLCMNDDLLQPLIIGLGVLCILLLVVILYLVHKVCVLRRRPRIKKRIIVSKNVTPLTSRPPPPGDQCEITIENCCNMNICETPCYEPQLRTSKEPSKTEEKKNLLGNMEVGSTCSPCQENLY